MLAHTQISNIHHPLNGPPSRFTKTGRDQRICSVLAYVCARSFPRSKTGRPTLHGGRGGLWGGWVPPPQTSGGGEAGQRKVTPLGQWELRAALSLRILPTRGQVREALLLQSPAPRPPLGGQLSRQLGRGQAEWGEVSLSSQSPHKEPTVAAQLTISPGTKAVSHLPRRQKLVIWGLQSHLWKSRQVPT